MVGKRPTMIRFVPEPAVETLFHGEFERGMNFQYPPWMASDDRMSDANVLRPLAKSDKICPWHCVRSSEPVDAQIDTRDRMSHLTNYMCGYGILRFSCCLRVSPMWIIDLSLWLLSHHEPSQKSVKKPSS